VAAIKRLLGKKNYTNREFFNIGTGKGASVLEVIKAFEAVSGIKLNYVFKDRRDGDVASYLADTTKANKVLGWKSELSLKDALASAWKWEKKLNLNDNII
jgi:UDP-glucose 4-epimerase